MTRLGYALGLAVLTISCWLNNAQIQIFVRPAGKVKRPEACPGYWKVYKRARVPGFNLKAFKVEGPPQCARKCLSIPRCTSFEMYNMPSMAHVCQLNYGDPFSHIKRHPYYNIFIWRCRPTVDGVWVEQKGHRAYLHKIETIYTSDMNKCKTACLRVGRCTQFSAYMGRDCTLNYGSGRIDKLAPYTLYTYYASPNIAKIKVESSVLKVDGKWSPWSWSACSKSCGLGTQKGMRTCDNPKPQGGGEVCSGNSSAQHDCYVERCPLPQICQIPFRYKGQIYFGCTNKGADKNWCSLTPVYNGSSKVCSDNETQTFIKNQRCAIPFKDQGHSFRGCIIGSDGKYWCSLTPIYEGAFKYCSSEEVANFGKSQKCAIPFTYKNISYFGCTTKDNLDHKHWCSLYAEYNGTIKYCSSTEVEEYKKNQKCAIPFMYQGKKYTGCTKIGGTKYWCSLTTEYKGAAKYCTSEEVEEYKYNGVCSVPFEYEGRKFYGCKMGSDGKEWCSLTPVYTNQFKYCTDEDVIKYGKVTNCSMPFTMAGKTYFGCTKGKQDYFWCSVTPTFTGEVKSCTDSDVEYYRSKQVCSIPFTYKGERKHGCIKTGGAFWCSLTPVYEGAYKNCSSEEVERYKEPGPQSPMILEEGGPLKDEVDIPLLDLSPPDTTTAPQIGEQRCAIPFTYRDVEYFGCTKIDSDKYWCSLTQEYAGTTKTCTAEEVTEYDNRKTCSIPFENAGRKVYGCKPDLSGKHWCSLTPVYKTAFKYCSEDEVAYYNNRSKCVVPFTANGKDYFGCTKENDTAYWCSLTREVGSQIKYCTSKDVERYIKAQKCAMPFTYKGKEYHTCTKDDSTTYWCSLTSVYNGATKQCSDEEVEEYKQSVHCAIPFVYKGIKYFGCTKVGATNSWCSLTANYSGKSKDCSDVEVEKYENQKKCSVPYTYDGNVVYGCVPDAKPWCSLTPVYEKAYKYCSPDEAKQLSQAHKCAIPFEYKGNMHFGCTKDGKTNPWCSLNAKFNGTIKYCTSEEVAKYKSMMKCAIPFTYAGKQYFGCTKTGATAYWCSLTPHYQGASKTCSDEEVQQFESTKKCAIPYLYKERLVYGCVITPGAKPWCSLTPEYNGIYKDCSEQEVSTYRTSHQCAIPFDYQGKKYFGCTKTNANGYWCSLGAQYNAKSIKYCTEPEVKELEAKQKCVIPFTYNGAQHRKCIPSGDKYWCSLTPIYEGAFKYCSDEERTQLGD